MPSHSYNLTVLRYHGNPSVMGSGSTPAFPMNTSSTPSTTEVGGGESHSHGDTGNVMISTNVVQPFITTYFWKRQS